MESSPASVFGFEKEYAADLHFMPVGIRYRLDLAGLKVSLDAWLRLSVPERFELLEMGVESDREIGLFRAKMVSALLNAGAGTPPVLAPLDPADWSKGAPIPECVRRAAAADGISLAGLDWPALSDSRRYALWKLSLSRRQPEAFQKAVAEFAGPPG